MAETVRGISVVISGDTTKLGKALEDVNKKSKDIQSELRQVERLLKFDPKNTTLLAQKQQLLAKQIENTSEKLNRLKSVQQQVNEQFRRGEISEGQYRAFQREIEKTQGQLNNLRSKLDETNASINKHTTAWGKMQERLSSVGNNLRDVGQRMQSVGQSMATSMGAAATAIGGALGFAVKKSMDFEAQIDRVGAIAGATPSELKKLEKASLDLGASTSKSATEVAEGMEIMAAMGYNTNQILAAMPGIIAAAEASGEDMALVADTVSSALNSFGLEAAEAARVADVLAQAANDSAAGIKDMQYTFKYAAPVASQLGISLEQLAAAAEIMANNGIRGEQAGTTLRAALIRLSDPPKEAAATLKELGVRVKDSSGKMLPFNQIIAQLSKSTEKMGNAQKIAALSTIFGTEAASGMLTVIEAGPEKFDELTKSLENSAGASQEAAQKMKDNLKGSLEELQGAFETAQIIIGNALAPAIEKVARYIQNLIDRFNNLSPSAQKTIATIGAVAAVLAALGAGIGVTLGIIGAAASGIGALSTAFGTVAGVISKAGGMIGLFSKALGLITNPVGIAILAITGLVTVGLLVYKNWDKIKAFLLATWNAIKAAAKVVWDGLKSYFTTMLNIYKTIFTTVWNAIKTALTTVWNAIKRTASTVFNAIKTAISTIFNTIRSVVTSVWNGIKSTLTSIWNGLKSTASSVWNGIKSVISNVVNGIRSTVSNVWNGIKSTTVSVWNGIKSAITSPIEKAKNTVLGIIDKIKNAFSRLSIKIPKPKLPDIDVSWKSFGIGDLSVKIPKFSINWHAIGGVFERPVIFGNAGFGDVEEAIVPFEGRHARRIADLIGDAMLRKMQGLVTQNEPTRPIIIQIPLNGRVIAQATFRDIRELSEFDQQRRGRFKG
ncbi:phage tail tape measure protein [Geobacillus thermodenitrificans]|uniref:phage tail tape measure protein n=1 Tax=Geobacillus thermodenitrificans TaxID=33940 RepID=UPI002E247EDC|nr:phage tail tape measure protein [Geobacillus thermodenitrificans]MED4916708.1 phage tail tape measure protein [Geobacillus thermodenitrificans]